MKDQILKTRIFSNLGVTLCANAIEFPGHQVLEPDESKAYAEFQIAHAYPVITAYGTTMHPGTIANSYRSILHQVFNRAHQMRAYDRSKEKDQIPRDHILGSIVAVDFPPAPPGGWRLGQEGPPSIRAAAVIHKHAEGVPKILGEHLGGRHRWTVSMEVNYSILSSGFVVMNRPEASRKAAALLNEFTPDEFTNLGLGYVSLEQAPEDLLDTYDFERLRLKPKAAWQGLPVALLKGGINGRVHFQGVGLVRYGAEREASIQQISASDPDALPELSDEHLGLLTGYFGNVERDLKNLLTAGTKPA